MLDYRLYCLDEAGRFFRCEEYAAADDSAAIAQGKLLRGAHAAELWSGSRMVTVFPAPGGAAAGSAPPSLAHGAC